MIFGKNELPGMPARDKIFVRRDLPQETSEGGIIIPDKAQKLAHFGTIIHAGLDARDKMYDNGHEIGDYIWFGQFASILGEWDHYTDDIVDLTCAHDWDRDTSVGSSEWLRGFRCSKCRAGRVQEAIAVMSIDDIQVNRDLEARLRVGAVRIVRGKTSEGQTQHVIRRAPFFDDVANSVSTTAQVRLTNGV